MSGAGTGVAACMNCLNFLTTEFTAPERIPTYDNEKPNFPASKLRFYKVDNFLSFWGFGHSFQLNVDFVLFFISLKNAQNSE